MEGPSPRVAKETKTLQTDPGIHCSPDPNNLKNIFVIINSIFHR